MARSRSETPLSRRSRSARSDGDSSDDEHNHQYRLHIADLSIGMGENDIRKLFQRFGTLLDVWVASASGFAFVVYKRKKDAKRAIDEMNERSVENSRLKVTWARPRAPNRSRRYDPHVRCYKCGHHGHFSRECHGQSSSRRRDVLEMDRYVPPPSHPSSSSASFDRYPRSRCSPIRSAYYRPALPMYPPPLAHRFDPYMDRYYLLSDRYRDRGTRLIPPSASFRYTRR